MSNVQRNHRQIKLIDDIGHPAVFMLMFEKRFKKKKLPNKCFYTRIILMVYKISTHSKLRSAKKECFCCLFGALKNEVMVVFDLSVSSSSLLE